VKILKILSYSWNKFHIHQKQWISSIYSPSLLFIMTYCICHLVCLSHDLLYMSPSLLSIMSTSLLSVMTYSICHLVCYQSWLTVYVKCKQVSNLEEIHVHIICSLETEKILNDKIQLSPLTCCRDSSHTRRQPLGDDTSELSLRRLVLLCCRE
jgi:hypothetical protein